MEIFVREEILVALGVAIAMLVIAVIWLMIWMVKHLTGFAKALEAGQEVNASLNDELLEVVKTRNEERKEYDRERRELIDGFEQERTGFHRDIAKLRQEAETANHMLTTEFLKAKSKIQQLENDLRNLTLENEQLSKRITEMVAEGKSKDEKIAELERKLTFKVDKPDTDEVSESAAKVLTD